MKTWEMIKELTENPKKEFAVICEESQEETLVSTKFGEFIIKGYQKLFISDEWKEVKQPVNFMEAVASGKKIRVEHKSTDIGSRFKEALYLNDFLCMLQTWKTSSEIRDILTNGKFYTED